jgi:hypothetical protein
MRVVLLKTCCLCDSSDSSAIALAPGQGSTFLLQLHLARVSGISIGSTSPPGICPFVLEESMYFLIVFSRQTLALVHDPTPMLQPRSAKET